MILNRICKFMRAKVLIFFIAALFLSACGYELPKTQNGADNSANSQNRANQNANNPSNSTKNANASNSANPGSNGGNGDAKLILSGTSESRSLACEGREVEIEEEATAGKYTLTGECKKITVDGVSNEVTVEKVGEIVLKGTSNKVVYVEGIGGKKPKITNTGVSTSAESKKSVEEKQAKEAANQTK